MGKVFLSYGMEWLDSIGYSVACKTFFASNSPIFRGGGVWRGAGMVIAGQGAFLVGAGVGVVRVVGWGLLVAWDGPLRVAVGLVGCVRSRELGMRVHLASRGLSCW